MAIFNLRRVSTVTTGTGTITLGSAITGFKAFSDTTAIPDQTWVTYAIADTANSEQGYGLYSTSGSTLTRNVVESTNSNNPISLSGSAQVFITPLSGDIQSDTAFPTRLRNGGMDVWQRGTSSITVTTAGAYTADGWIVLPSGASVTAAQATGRLLTAYSLKITGATSVTDVIIKQRIESLIAAPMSSQQVIFQAWVNNGTGGSITPTLTVKHPTTTDNYAATSTDVSAVSLQPCANGAWTQLIYVFTASSSSALGMEVAIDFGNNFSSGAKTIQLTEADLRVAPGYPSGLTYIAPEPQFRPIQEELIFCQRYFCKSYGQSVAPGSSVSAGTGGVSFSPGLSGAGATSSLGTTFRHPVVMRATPTAVIYDNAGTASRISYYNAGWNNGSTVTNNFVTDAVIMAQNNDAGIATSYDYTASAEL